MSWEPWMGPRVNVYEAQRSPDARRRRDLELAAWCGLTESEVIPYMRFLEVYDLHEQARRISEAEVAIDHARLDADLAAFWTANPEPSLRVIAGGRISRRLPRARPAA